MSSDFYMDHAPNPRLHKADLVLPAVFLVLLSLGAGFGLGQKTGQPASSGIALDSPAPQAQIEDWHGNVMRSGGY